MSPVRTHNSDGLGLMQAAAAASEAVKLLEPGFTAVKLRLGRSDHVEDIAVTRAVRDAIGPSAHLMVDYNQALTLSEALHRARAIEPFDIYWLEEQIRHGDLQGYARLTNQLCTSVMLGENLDGPEAVLDAVRAGAGSHLMLDVASEASPAGCARQLLPPPQGSLSLRTPEISVHLLASTPGAHWLE